MAEPYQISFINVRSSDMVNVLLHAEACVMGFCYTHKHINRGIAEGVNMLVSIIHYVA